MSLFHPDVPSGEDDSENLGFVSSESRLPYILSQRHTGISEKL